MRLSRASPGEDFRFESRSRSTAAGVRTASVDNRVVEDLGGGAGGFDFPRISMTTFVVGSDASIELTWKKSSFKYLLDRWS